MGKKNTPISLVKHLEYFDGHSWKPIIWYSNRSDNDFEQNFKGPELIEHSDIFYNSFNNFTELIENSEIEKRGLPDDLSDYIKDKILSNPGTFYGASYYYMSELKSLIAHEEELLISELKNGIEIKLFDDGDKLKQLLLNDGNIEFNESTEKEGETTVRVIRTMAKTVEQLKYIAGIVSKLVYEVHGFIEDDKIRVVFYYKQ